MLGLFIFTADTIISKRPRGDITNLKNSANQQTFVQLYDYTISFIKKEKKHYLLFKN